MEGAHLLPCTPVLWLREPQLSWPVPHFQLALAFLRLRGQAQQAGGGERRAECQLFRPDAATGAGCPARAIVLMGGLSW